VYGLDVQRVLNVTDAVRHVHGDVGRVLAGRERREAALPSPAVGVGQRGEVALLAEDGHTDALPVSPDLAAP